MPVDNLPGERIESLVDELEGIIEEARPPFGKSAQQKIIETDVFFNILDEIRMSYPEEWQKSRRILKERYQRNKDDPSLLLRPGTGQVYAPAIVRDTETVREIPRHNFHSAFLKDRKP